LAMVRQLVFSIAPSVPNDVTSNESQARLMSFVMLTVHRFKKS
jgi:hypothetical protein